MTSNTQHLIIGYGYLGRHLSRLLHRQTLWLSSRQAARQQRSQRDGHHTIYLDINHCNDLSWPDSLKDSQAIQAYCLVPPSQIDSERFSIFLQRLFQLNIQRALMTSSTVVYGKASRHVDADSEVMIDSPRAQRQFALEQQWHAYDSRCYIVRLAGLYGPGRIIGKQLLLNDNGLDTDPQAWLNLLHAADAANLLFHIMNAQRAGRIELGCDNHPVRRIDYYSWLAKQLNTSPPRFLASARQRGGDRQCSSVITQKRTDWSPEYVDYRKGLQPLLDNHDIPAG